MKKILVVTVDKCTMFENPWDDTDTRNGYWSSELAITWADEDGNYIESASLPLGGIHSGLQKTRPLAHDTLMELAYAVVKSFRAIDHPAYIVDLETGWDGSEYHLGFYLKERQHLVNSNSAPLICANRLKPCSNRLKLCHLIRKDHKYMKALLSCCLFPLLVLAGIAALITLLPILLPAGLILFTFLVLINMFTGGRGE